jgi:hypothetical protein
LPDGRFTWKYVRRFIESGPKVVMSALRGLPEQAREVPCSTLVVRGGESDVVTREAAAFLASLVTISVG